MRRDVYSCIKATSGRSFETSKMETRVRRMKRNPSEFDGGMVAYTNVISALSSHTRRVCALNDSLSIFLS